MRNSLFLWLNFLFRMLKLCNINIPKQAFKLQTKCSLRKLQQTTINLAGHSKWENIRHTKSLKDEEKSSLFARLSKQIRFAVQAGGGSTDLKLNSQLRSVVEEALRKSMPMSTIQSNIKRSRQTDVGLKKYQIFLRFKQKVVLICILYTDNFSNFKIQLAPIAKRFGAKYTDSGHMFEDFGLVQATLSTKDSYSKGQLEERVTADAISCGAEDVEVKRAEAGHVHFICSPMELKRVSEEIEKKGYTIESAEHIFVAKNLVTLSKDEEVMFHKFIEQLRSLHGLEEIYDNLQWRSS